MAIPTWLAVDKTAKRFMDRCGMRPDDAFAASERVAILIHDAGMPEDHAVLLCEALWWAREAI